MRIGGRSACPLLYSEAVAIHQRVDHNGIRLLFHENAAQALDGIALRRIQIAGHGVTYENRGERCLAIQVAEPPCLINVILQGGIKAWVALTGGVGQATGIQSDAQAQWRHIFCQALQVALSDLFEHGTGSVHRILNWSSRSVTAGKDGQGFVVR